MLGIYIVLQFPKLPENVVHTAGKVLLVLGLLSVTLVILGMNDNEGVAGMRDALVDRIDKADTFVNLSQKYCTGIGGETAAVESRDRNRKEAIGID